MSSSVSMPAPQLKYTPLVYLGMGGLAPCVALYPYSGGAYAWVCIALGATAGIAGLHAMYRSPCGPLSLIGGTLLTTVLVLSITLGGIGSYFSIIMGQPDLATRAGLCTLLGLTPASLLGVRNGLRSVSGEPEAWLARWVDLQGLVMKQAPLPSYGEQPWQNLLLALGVSSPAVLEALGLGRYSLLLLLIPALVIICTRVVFLAGSEIVQLWHLRQYEVRHGLRFTSVHREDFRRQRRSLFLARWLCRPEDLAIPPAPGPVRRRRRMPGSGQESME